VIDSARTRPDMLTTMTITIARISRYPVKGLSAQELDAVELSPGEGLPEDRRFALAHGASAFDPAAPAWQPKSNFLVLAKNERLAVLDTEYDPATSTLTVRRNGRQIARGTLTTPTGRLVIEQFFEAYMGEEAFGRVRVVEAPGHMFSDARDKYVSLINAATVKDMERVAKAPLDPRRFRGNLLLEGMAPWAEHELLGRTLTIGGARLQVERRIPRCTATNVNLETGERDMNLPLALQRGYGHIDCGIYARVVDGGRIAIGDTVEALP